MSSSQLIGREERLEGKMPHFVNEVFPHKIKIENIDENLFNGRNEMQNIIENATIIYKNGLKKVVDAISITKNGIYTGKIRLNHNPIEGFVNYSFIPRDQIKKINFLNKWGESTDIFLEKCDREEKEK